MATKVVMPKLSPTMEEGQLSRWLKKEGDTVGVGEPLAEIDTDKATMEAQALATGVLRKVLVEEGQTVPLGAIIAIIGEPEEDISSLISESQSGAAQQKSERRIEEATEGRAHGSPDELAQVVPDGARTRATIEGEPIRGDVGKDASAQEGVAQNPVEAESSERLQTNDGAATGNGKRADGGRLIVSPIAARMAAEAGIKLDQLKGSGPGGRIIKRDVEEAMRDGVEKTKDSSEAPHLRAVPSQAPQAPSPPDVEGASPYREETVSTMRATIARRLVTSMGPVPHFFLTTEIEMDRAAELRRQLNELDEDAKISINDLIIKIVAATLIQHPAVNASFQDKTIRYYERADIGVAVAVEDGLITPVVRAANTKTVGQISREVRELAERARSRRLKPEEYTGATFSISNLGMFGIDEFTAVINPPEAAILAVGAMAPKPVARDGEIVVRQMMRVTMSCDHRVIDGATGAKFLQTLKKILENPLYLLA